MTQDKDQAPLEFEPVVITQEVVEVRKIKVEEWGSPPEDSLVKSVALFGVLSPVLLDSKGRVVDGRRRVLAAVKAGATTIPASRVQGAPGLLDPALTLASNAHTSPNPVIELDALEALMHGVGSELPAVDLARATGVPLKVVRKRLRLRGMNTELRDGWRRGAFGTVVGLAAAKLDESQQRELAKRLAAAGVVTLGDIAEVKKISVSSHQRTLPGDAWKNRAGELLRKARNEVFLALGSSETLTLIDKALSALADESDDA